MHKFMRWEQLVLSEIDAIFSCLLESFVLCYAIQYSEVMIRN